MSLCVLVVCAGLLEHTGHGETPLLLCAFSTGGAVAVEYASRHPSQVLRMLLLAPTIMPVEKPLVRPVIHAQRALYRSPHPQHSVAQLLSQYDVCGVMLLSAPCLSL